MARKTVLVCDKCGAEVEEGKGAVMRVTFTDARRGAKAADLCDRVPADDARCGRRPPRAKAEVARVRPGAPAVPEPRSHAVCAPCGKSSRGACGVSRDAGSARLRCAGGALPRRRSGTCRQGRAAARPVRRCLDRDPWLIVPNRADVERVERELVARCGGLALRHDRDVRHAVRVARPRRRDGGGRRFGDAERTHRRQADLPSAAEVDGARYAGFADAVGRALAELEASLLEPHELSAAARRARRGLPRGARAARTPGTAACCGAAPSSG